MSPKKERQGEEQRIRLGVGLLHPECVAMPSPYAAHNTTARRCFISAFPRTVRFGSHNLEIKLFHVFRLPKHHLLAAGMQLHSRHVRAVSGTLKGTHASTLADQCACAEVHTDVSPLYCMQTKMDCRCVQNLVIGGSFHLTDATSTPPRLIPLHP